MIDISFCTFYQSGERLRRSESDSIKEVTPLRRSNDKFNKKENRILFYFMFCILHAFSYKKRLCTFNSLHLQEQFIHAL